MTRVSGITVLLYTQGLNSNFAFRIYSMIFFCLCFYLRLFGRLLFQKFIFLIKPFKILKIHLLTYKQFVGVFFHCVFNPVKAIKSEQLAVFSFAKRRKFSLSRHFVFLYWQDMS
jgi:hypothetical protein